MAPRRDVRPHDDLKTGDPETKRSWTVFLFAQSRLPYFVCVPRRWTAGGDRARLTPINFDPRGEDERTVRPSPPSKKSTSWVCPTRLSASGEDAIRRLFCTPRLEAMAQYPNWHVQSAGGFLVFALSWTAAAADRTGTLGGGPRTSPGAAGAAVLSRDSDSRRARDGRGPPAARRGGRRAGCLAGAVLGGFGSFIAFSAFMATRMVRPPPGSGRSRCN